MMITKSYYIYHIYIKNGIWITTMKFGPMRPTFHWKQRCQEIPIGNSDCSCCTSSPKRALVTNRQLTWQWWSVRLAGRHPWGCLHHYLMMMWRIAHTLYQNSFYFTSNTNKKDCFVADCCSGGSLTSWDCDLIVLCRQHSNQTSISNKSWSIKTYLQ